MSEQKRATLLTISTQKGDVKKVKEKSKTIRFSLTLPESNEKSCPEYNYKDLLNSAEKKTKGKVKNDGHVNGLNPGLNHLDPFDEDDEDVIRISKQFEEKYGNIPKKKRRGKNDDYVDIGAGYDESDSFIDNTDAYDEIIPADITTVHGGFYINSGALEFKQVEYSGSEDSSDSNHSDKVAGTSRKRIIEDTDESDSENEKDETKKEEGKSEHVEKKQKIETNGLPKQPAAKKKLILDDKENKELKKRKVDENLLKKKAITVKDLLREKREELDVTPEIDSPVKENKPSGNNNNSSTINDAIESVINAVRAKNVDENSKESTSSSELAVVSAATTESESSREAQLECVKQEYDNIPSVKLPDDIPPHILEIINNIKKAAENSSEGKVKFFSTSVNNMLLSLETHTRKLIKLTRIAIYEHLAPFVKCKKDTLMRRAKNLLLDHERTKLKDSMQRLKTIVDNLMPIVKKSYERECQKVRDEMFLASANSNAENGGDLNCKIKRTPRKKFPWTDESRKIFQDIVVTKKKCYPLEGHRKEPFEIYIDQFFKTEVLTMWPEGWMSIAGLNKQAKIITENNVKQKMLKSAKPMKPISLDISATFSPVMPFHSPVRKSPSCPGASGITVIPIPSPSMSSPKSSLNGPGPVTVKMRQHSPAERKTTNDLSVVSISKKPVSSTATTTDSSSSVLNLSAEICAVNPKETNNSSLLIPSSNSSVTITNVDQRTTTNSTAIPTIKEEDITISLTTSATTSTSKSANKTIEQPKSVLKPVDLVTKPIIKTIDLHTKPVNEPVINKTKAIDVSTTLASTSSASTTSSTINKPPTNLKQRILDNINKQIATATTTTTQSTSNPIQQTPATPPTDSNDDCQIIDLTESPIAVNRKPGPKSKTRNPDGSIKVKRPKEHHHQHHHHQQQQQQQQKQHKKDDGTISVRKTEELTGSQALNQLITGLTKYGSSSDVKHQQKETPNEDDMEQVMKDLKELQQMQEHARHDLDVMSPSSSPVSVIAYNSNYSPSKIQPDDLSKTRRQSTDGPGGFQDIFQKHLYQDAPIFKSSQSSSVVYNAQQKNNYNSVNNFPGTISNTMNNIRYSQSSSKYPTNLTHLSANTAGATNHTDDFALFQNFLYQYGFHNSTGSKQKSPP